MGRGGCLSTITTENTMKTNIFKVLILLPVLAISIISCYDYGYEDDGPLQYEESSYAPTGFTRIEMGDALVANVEHGNYFSVKVRGDRRNIDDLEVRRIGSTLFVYFEDTDNRQYETYVDIIMPDITAASFSGACTAAVYGFDVDMFSLTLSGASIAEVDITAETATFTISGASIAELFGESTTMSAEVSGASIVKGFGFPADQATLEVSGASECKVTVLDQLHATVSGASNVLYRGNPVVTGEVSDASSVRHDSN